MSGLKIGLVATLDDESQQLVQLLHDKGAQVVHNIPPAEITPAHIGDEAIHVWLLNVADDSWHDAVDQLLDESQTPVYFSEPGTLSKQPHPEFWAENLMLRLYEITGLERGPQDIVSDKPAEAEPAEIQPEPDPEPEVETQAESAPPEVTEAPTSTTEESEMPLAKTLEELEGSAVGLSQDIAAELVSELESISPVLEVELEQLASEAEPSVEETSQDEAPLEDINAEVSESEIELMDDDAASFESDSHSLEDFELDESIAELSDETEVTESPEAAETEADNAAAPNSDDELFNAIDQGLDFGEESEIELMLDESSDDENQTEQLDLDENLDLDFSIDLPQADDPENSDFDNQETAVAENSGAQVDAFDDSLELALVDTEETQAPITGRAQYTIDDSDELPVEATAEQAAEIEPQQEEESPGGLSLEAIDDERPVSGKANFLEDEAAETEEQPEQVDSAPVDAEIEADEFEGGLELAAIEEESSEWLETDDIQEHQADNAAETATDEPQIEIDESALDQLELVPTDDESEAEDAINDHSQNAEPIEADAQQADVAIDTSELTLTDETLEMEPQVVAEIARDAVDDSEEQAFEIPMLDEAAVNIEFEEQQLFNRPASEFTPCWVIGASLGGPAAVKRFLHAIPADLNISFIITQHIDENFLPVLAEILTANSHFEVKVAQGSVELQPGDVYLAPLNGKLVLLQDGSMLVDRSQKWSGPYSPCIDDVIESVSQVYREVSGAIIFSGMGEDGVQGAKKMRELGGQVWAQTADTCANPSMPSAIVENGQADFVGSPEQLADKLVEQVRLSRAG